METFSILSKVSACFDRVESSGAKRVFKRLTGKLKAINRVLFHSTLPYSWAGYVAWKSHLLRLFHSLFTIYWTTSRKYSWKCLKICGIENYSLKLAKFDYKSTPSWDIVRLQVSAKQSKQLLVLVQFWRTLWEKKLINITWHCHCCCQSKPSITW